jgi:hypothetical protein
MARRLSWSAAALALAVLAGSVSPALASDADERPHLKVELVGLPIPASQRNVKVRVTNVTKWWADETTLTVETVAPTAGNPTTFKVENLDPGQSATFTYTLAAPCDGQTVKARIKPPMNYKRDPKIVESLSENKPIEAQACPPKAQPAAKPNSVLRPEDLPIPAPTPALGDPVDPGTATTTRGRPASAASVPRPVPENAVDPGTAALKPATAPAGRSAGVQALEGVIPVHTRPGKHTLELKPSLVRSLATLWQVQLREGGFRRSTEDRDTSDPTVGWQNIPGIQFFVAETAMNFDLKQLLEVQQPVIESAHLSFVEHEDIWGSSAEQRRENPGCVAELGMATNDWAGPLSSFASQPNNLFRYKRLTSKLVPHTRTAEETAGGFRQRAFVVTDHVKNQLQQPNDVALWFGYVLYGPLDDLNRSPDGGCTSRITDLTLHITYVVPAN